MTPLIRLGKIALYLVAVAYPLYELGVDQVGAWSYEGVGSLVFPVAVLGLQICRCGKRATFGSVFTELLFAAVFATLGQLVYLGIQGYQTQPEGIKSMIRIDWLAMPVVLGVLWILNRRQREVSDR